MRLKQSQCFSSKPQKTKTLSMSLLVENLQRELEFQVVADEIRFLEEILVQEF